MDVVPVTPATLFPSRGQRMRRNKKTRVLHVAEMLAEQTGRQSSSIWPRPVSIMSNVRPVPKSPRTTNVAKGQACYDGSLTANGIHYF